MQNKQELSPLNIYFIYRTLYKPLVNEPSYILCKEITEEFTTEQRLKKKGQNTRWGILHQTPALYNLNIVTFKDYSK